MDESKVDDVVDLLDSSVCRDCTYMVSRVLLPIGPEAFDMDPEEYEEVMLDEEGITFEQNTCILLNMDLAYAVIKCNKYLKQGSEVSIFKGIAPWK